MLAVGRHRRRHRGRDQAATSIGPRAAVERLATTAGRLVEMEVEGAGEAGSDRERQEVEGGPYSKRNRNHAPCLGAMGLL